MATKLHKDLTDQAELHPNKIDGTTGTELTLPSQTTYDGRYVRTIGGTITPSSNSTTTLKVTKADGTTQVFDIDTTNARVGIGTITPKATLAVINAWATGANVPTTWAAIFGGRFGLANNDLTFYFDINASYAEFSSYNWGNATTVPFKFQANAATSRSATSPPLPCSTLMVRSHRARHEDCCLYTRRCRLDDPRGWYGRRIHRDTAHRRRLRRSRLHHQARQFWW